MRRGRGETEGPATMARISLKGLRHSYREAAGVRVGLGGEAARSRVAEGSANALLGPRAAARRRCSTSSRGCSGRPKARCGSTTRRDRAAGGRAQHRQVFQFPVVYDTMSVYDNLAFPLRNRGMPERDVDRRVREIAALLDLDAMLQQRAAGLTADGKQKISLGRGLVRSDVAVIMFDEPLTVIDPHLKWRLRSKLKELHQRLRTTMIYVTQ